MSGWISPDQLPDDPQALKQTIAAMVDDAVAAEAEIAKLRFQLARYQLAEFGRSSEKLAREAEQLELRIEALRPIGLSGSLPPRQSLQRSRARSRLRSRQGVRCGSTCRART